MTAVSPLAETSLISAEERASREEAVDFARGSVRFEGVHLTREMEELNERFINGELTDEQHSAQLLALCKAG